MVLEKENKIGNNYYSDNELIVINIIVDTVCDYFNINDTQIITKSRKDKYVYPRYFLYYLLNKHVGMCHEDIASFVGCCKRANVCIAIGVISSSMNKDDNVNLLVLDNRVSFTLNRSKSLVKKDSIVRPIFSDDFFCVDKNYRVHSIDGNMLTCLSGDKTYSRQITDFLIKEKLYEI